MDAIGSLHWGTHFCHFYETLQDLLDILVPFFRSGIENGELCIWIVFDPLTEESALKALRDAVPDADRRIEAGDIQIVPHATWFLDDSGRFDLNRTMAHWRASLAKARERRYAGLRGNGNEAWLSEQDWRDFMRFEHELNHLIAGQRMILMCTYPLPKVSGSGVFDVARSHRFAVAIRHGVWEVLETPELQHAKDELRALTEEFEGRVRERTGALDSANAYLRAMAARLEAAREEERTRISRELHDELGSRITSLRWDLEALQRLTADAIPSAGAGALQDQVDSILRLTDGIVESTRRIASDLRPRILDDLGLVEAVQWQASQFQDRTNLTCRFESSVDSTHLTPAQSTAVFRILQEALTNIIRHARASEVEILIREEDGRFILSVTDNGIGADMERIAPGSLGIWGMQERAQVAGGSVRIEGRPGRGTTVEVGIPLRGK